MQSSEKKDFSALLKATLEVYGSQLSAEAVSIWWLALSRFDIHQVRHALSLHIQSNKFPPRPADVITAIQVNDGRLGPEEAWAIVAPGIADERVTMVWTPEMQRAFGAALPLADDPVAARMAYLEVYRRELTQARSAGEPVRWQVSLGTDAAGREAALLDAVDRGRLPAQHVAGLLPQREQPNPRLEAMLAQTKALTCQ